MIIYTYIVGLWDTLLRVWEQQIDEHHEHPDLQPTPPQRSWNSGIASREKVEACDLLPRDLQQVLGLDPSDWLAVFDHVESCWIRYWIMFPWICQFPWPFLVSIIFDIKLYKIMKSLVFCGMRSANACRSSVGRSSKRSGRWGGAEHSDIYHEMCAICIHVLPHPMRLLALVLKTCI